MEEEKIFKDPQNGILLVKNGHYAYHAEPDIAYPYIERYFNNKEICDLTEVHLLRPTYLMYTMPYNSSYAEITKLA